MATIRVKNPNLGGEKWITIPTKILSEADHIVTNKGQGDLYLSNDGTYKDVIKSANDYTDKLIELITGSSPDILETLKELSNQTSDNKDFINVLNKSIATKLDKTANAVSASKLATPIKLWGNDFDGSLSVYGNLCAPNGNLALGISTNNVVLGNNTNPSYIYGSSVMFKTGTDAVAAYISSDGKVGIGTANPLVGFHVNVDSYFDYPIKVSGEVNYSSPLLKLDATNTNNNGLLVLSKLGNSKAAIGIDDTQGMWFLNLSNSNIFRITSNSLTYGSNKIWHEGNFNPSDYLPLSGGIINAKEKSPLKITGGLYGEVSIGFFKDGNEMSVFGYTETQGTFMWDNVSHSRLYLKNNKLFFSPSSSVAAETIWHSGNDGEGSGLDADTLDGYHKNQFQKALYDYIISDNTAPDNTLLPNILSYGSWSTGAFGFVDTKFYNRLETDANRAQLVYGYSSDFIKFRRHHDKQWSNWKTIAFTDSDITGNAATATKATQDSEGNVITDTYTVKDGYYKDMRVGLADDLGGIEEKVESEYTIQPTANTSEIRDGYALIESLKGNSIVWNLLFDGVVRSSGSSENVLQDGKYICTPIGTPVAPGSGSWSSGWSNIVRGVFPGKYLVRVTYTRSSKRTDIDDFILSDASVQATYTDTVYKFPIEIGETKQISCIINILSGDDTSAISVSLNDCIVELSDISVINLTKMFGEGNEPETIEEFYARIPQGIDLYAYNEGEIINLTADSIKSVGFNQWDEEWEVGGISANGNLSAYSDRIRSKNYIPCVPNTWYYAKGYFKHGIFFYDENKKWVKDKTVYGNNFQFFTPSNAVYMLLNSASERFTEGSYCINLYNEDSNGTYEPYKEFVRQLPTNLFEGGMKSAGDVYDEIYWDKNKKKYIKVTRIGSIDLGSLEWERTVKAQAFSEYKFVSKIKISDINGVSSSLRIICSNYLRGSVNEEGTDKVLEIGNSINIVDNRYTDANTFKQAMQGVVLQYELKETIIEELDIPYMDYEVSNDGTEMIESSTPSTPIKASITYNFDAVNTIKLNRFDISDIKKGATKLAKPVKLWGNDFDGSNNVNGDISLGGKKIYWHVDPEHYYIGTSYTMSSQSTNLDYEAAAGHRFLSFNKELLRITTSGYVGVGTTDPKSKLDVNGSISNKDIINCYLDGTLNRLTIRMVDNTGMVYAFNESESGYKKLLIGRNDGTTITIAENGNVGIGTYYPLYKLDVNGSIHTNSSIILDNNTPLLVRNSEGVALNAIHMTANNLLQIGLGTYNNGYSTQIIGKNVYLNYGNPSYTGMILNSSGNVTIGSSDLAGADCKLYVNGSMILPNNTNVYSLNTSGVVCSILHLSAYNLCILGYGTSEKGYDTRIEGNNISFRYGTSHSKGMLINSSGNVTIGESDLADSNYKLYVNGTSRFNGPIIINNENYLYAKTTDNENLGLIKLSNSNNLFVGEQVGLRGNHTYICGNNIYFRYGLATDSGFLDNAMVITNTGDVGIGTTNPEHKLDVIGSIRASQLIVSTAGFVVSNNKCYYTIDSNKNWVDSLAMTSGDGLVIGSGTTRYGYHTYIDGTLVVIRTSQASKPAMIINPSGNVTIGDSNMASVYHKLFVDGSVRTGQMYCTGDVVFGANSDGIYIKNSTILMHDSSNAYTTGAVTFTKLGDALFLHDISVINKIESGDLVDWYGVSWSEDSSDPTCTRIGNAALHRSLPILSAMILVSITNAQSSNPEQIRPLTDEGKLKYGINNNDIHPIGNDDFAQNIMVKIPEFWYVDDYEPLTKTHNLKISQTAKAGWCHHKESYVGAYEGYNSGKYYGSNRGAIPTVSVSRTTLRPLARANGYEGEYKWNIYTYEEHRAICHLFLVEYATRNSQAPVNTELTPDGFKQGGLGSGCTTGTVTINGQTTYSFIPTGTTDSLGNGSGQVAYTVTLTDADGNEIGTVTRYANRYRGIENPFGHIWKHVDDIVNVYNAETTYKTVYKCNKPEHFATNKNAKYKPLCSFPGGSKMQGWSKEIKATINCDFFKYSVGGSESTYWCDYNYDNDDTTEHCLLIGSNSVNGDAAGLFRFDLDSGVGVSSGDVGSRLTYLPWAE